MKTTFMSTPDNQPKHRFEEGKPFPNADSLYADFQKRPDYLDRLLNALQYDLFLLKKAQAYSPEVKTQDDFRKKAIEIHDEVYSQSTIEQIMQLAKKMGVTLNRQSASRYAFASYIYHDSEWSGIKIDVDTFIVTDGR